MSAPTPYAWARELHRLFEALEREANMTHMLGYIRSTRAAYHWLMLRRELRAARLAAAMGDQR